MARTPITLTDTVAKKILNMQGLANYDAKIKDFVDTQIAALPEEQYLDQTKTTIVTSFAWSAADYPGSTNPNLDGKPVLVFAVVNVSDDPDTVSYSFVSLDKLVDVYTADNTGKKAVDIAVSDDYKISAELKIKTAGEGEAANLATISADGELYVPTPTAFDASGITGRLDTLEGTVGKAADGEDPATGLVKSVADLESNKVDKVEGKGLSTNDYDATAVAEVAKIANKVDKVDGKGLSTNDYDADAVAEVAKIANKVDKVEGKGLSTNDYDADAKAAVDGLATTYEPIGTAAGLVGTIPSKVGDTTTATVVAYVDAKVGAVSGELNYAEADDIATLFA